jgi:hypothetical protein
MTGTCYALASSWIATFYVGLLNNFLSDTEYKVSAQELIECSTTGMHKNNGVTGGFAENVNYLLIWL